MKGYLYDLGSFVFYSLQDLDTTELAVLERLIAGLSAGLVAGTAGIVTQRDEMNNADYNA